MGGDGGEARVWHGRARRSTFSGSGERSASAQRPLCPSAVFHARTESREALAGQRDPQTWFPARRRPPPRCQRASVGSPLSLPALAGAPRRPSCAPSISHRLIAQKHASGRPRRPPAQNSSRLRVHPIAQRTRESARREPQQQTALRLREPFCIPRSSPPRPFLRFSPPPLNAEPAPAPHVISPVAPVRSQPPPGLRPSRSPQRRAWSACHPARLACAVPELPFPFARARRCVCPPTRHRAALTSPRSAERARERRAAPPPVECSGLGHATIIE